jgi:dienelactone hydrolase
VSFILQMAGMLFLASVGLVLVVRLALRLLGRRPRRFWRRAAVVLLVLIPVHALVLAPLGIAWRVTHGTLTRPDERGYAGPRVRPDGTWEPQSRATLAAARGAGPTAEQHAVRFRSRDGTGLRAFHVPARERPEAAPRAVLVHGLFRGALELEPVAAMLHGLGCEVLVLELRGHGASGRAVPTFGLRESEDVEAAARFLAERPGAGRGPLVLFGVSLGTAAVALAAPRVAGLAGLVLDSPMAELEGTAERFLGGGSRRFTAIPQPFRFALLESVQLCSGIRFSGLRPIESLAALPDTIAALVVGGGLDHRMPPEVVRRVHDALRAPPGRKELWIREGSEHGQVWLDDPAGYRARLGSLISRL